MRSDLDDRDALKLRFETVRAQTRQLVDVLSPEDMQVQTMPDVSPTKWHLAHTSWFFETFALEAFVIDYKCFDELYNYLYNSYYEAIGDRWCRPERGSLSRPLLSDILNYRAHVEERVLTLIENASENAWRELAPIIDLGLHHEQQHQELICTDIKHVLSRSPRPFAPFPREDDVPSGSASEMKFIAFEGGQVEMGAVGEGFRYDNEIPRHKLYAYPFALAHRPVTNKEFLQFLEDGGYQRASHWLADGWTMIQEQDLTCPLYWRPDGEGGWQEYTLHGLKPINPDEPVCHVSAYEAAAFADWTGMRLPLEHELELLAHSDHEPGELLFAHDGIHPSSMNGSQTPEKVTGGVWEWTSSSYHPYPGYRTPPGAVGEYNGKFMSGQQVLRGGSCATPADHIRASYRNFFPPASRWQFAGIRLAKDLDT